MRKLFLLALIALVLPLVSVKAEEKPYKIACVLMEVENIFYQFVADGMKKAAAESGNELVIGNSEANVLTEAKLVDAYVAQGLDAICISAFNSSASEAALRRAKRAGLIVVNFNTTMKRGMDYFVGADNFGLGSKNGKMIAEFVEKNLGGKAKVGLITISMFEVGVLRHEGFLSEIKKLPGIEVVGMQDGRTPEEAQKKAEAMLQANPDLKILWGSTDAATTGILAAVRAKGKEKDVIVLATDISPQLCRELMDPASPLMSIVAQRPEEMGYQAYMTALKVMQGETMPEQVLVPVDLYVKGNQADENGIREWLKTHEVENLLKKQF